jgi:hypothetical protein
VVLVKNAAPARCLILYGPLRPAIQGAAREPLAFAILDIANSLPTGGAAVARQVADRIHGVFVAAWPVA